MNLGAGPDGALYVVDFYRGVIQHRISLTTYLRQQSVARGLAQPTGLGRIWRIVPVEHKPATATLPADKTPAQWVALLSHANAWQRETAQRLLVERGDKSTVPALESLADQGPEPLGRLHALWTLDGLRAMSGKVADHALDDSDPRVRAAALRVSEPLLAGGERAEVLAKWIAMARTESAPEVQLQLALSLGEARDGAADAAMAALFQRSAGGHTFLREAVLSGLAGRELELLEAFVGKSDADPLLAGLARCVMAERKPDRVERLLDLIAALPTQASAHRLALLAAAATEPSAIRKSIKLPAEPAALAKLREKSSGSAKATVEKVATLLVWPGKPGVPEEPPLIALTAAEQARFEMGRVLFTAVCSACHQPHGLGMEGLAPPLVDSEWVLGPVARLGRIVLNGVRGPLKVNGALYSLDMPAMGVFDDEQVASILTYIRREWEQTAAPVEPATVKELRLAVAGHQDAWTQEELLKVR